MDTKKDEIYLVTSPSWEKGKVNIKIGRSANTTSRRKSYETHNPEAGFLQILETPSKVFSEFIEDALLFKIHRMRVSSTEWYKVDEVEYLKFKEIKTLKEVLEYCDFAYFLTTQEEISYSRSLDEDKTKKINAKTYEKHLTKYRKIREEMEVI